MREAQLALRRFFRFLVREGEIHRDPTTDMKLTSFRVEPQPTYSEPEVKRLLLACDSRTPSGILEVLGWRRIEMLRRYTAEVVDELAQAAHRRYSPGDALRVR